MNLPFTTIIPDRTPPRLFWHAPSTGDVIKDEFVGIGHAEALLGHLRRSPNISMFGWIIMDMTGKTLTPMQIAFWERIAIQYCK